MLGRYRVGVIPATEIQQYANAFYHPAISAFVGFTQRFQQRLDRFTADPYSYVHDRWLSGGLSASSLPAIPFFAYGFSIPFSERL
jgi:hypothetical protein